MITLLKSIQQNKEKKRVNEIYLKRIYVQLITKIKLIFAVSMGN